MSARMNLLGTFALEYQGTPVMISSQRMQVLLAYLALHRAEKLSRQRVAFLLWPDSSESQAFTNLRTLLHRLQAALPKHVHMIEIDSQTVGWSSECRISLDVAEFEAEISNANVTATSDDYASTGTLLERAIGRYAGDFFPDCYDAWILVERERLRQLLLAAVEQLVLWLEKERRYAAAIPHARRLTLLDPLNEAAYLTLMRLYAVNGDHASALRTYHTCASTLQAELGIRPGSALSTAYERLLAVEAMSPGEVKVNATWPLVGRDQAWKRMLAAWQVAASGQPRLLGLSGEAGVGKTRLAEDLLRWASRQGMMTVATQCYPAEGDLAYAPVAALIRHDALRHGLKLLSDEWLAEIARVAPDVIASRPGVQPPGPLTERWQRQRLFEALARVVLSADRPILLLVDDLQWCDRDSLEWLHFLLRYRQHARLLVVGTIRVEEVDLRHPLVELIGTLRREEQYSEIALDPLSRSAAVELAGHLAGRTFSEEEADHLYAETEGNALFIVETMRGVARTSLASTSLETDQLPLMLSGTPTTNLPPRIHAVIAWRLKRLSTETIALLEVAATIGRSFTFSLLVRAANLNENDLVRALDELWQRRILREQGPDAYDFTHDKLRAVAYVELSLTRKRVLHRRVAEALVGEYTAELDAVSGQVAMHYEQAGMVEQAVDYYRQAAAHARHLYAHEVAIAHFQHALNLLGEQFHPQRAKLYDQMGEVQHFTGRYEDARASWQNALDLIPEGDGLAQADLHRKVGNAWRDHHHYDEALQAYDMAEDALGNLNAEHSEALWSCWGQIKLERLNVLYWLGQGSEMLTLIEQIRPKFALVASTVQQARLQHISGIALLRANRYSLSPEAVQYVQEYLTLVEAMADKGALPAAYFQVGFTRLWASTDRDGAEAEIRAALSLAQRSGDISLECRCLTYLTVIARLGGQLDRTAELARASLEVAEAGQMHEYTGAAHGNLAWLAWREGDITASRSHGQKALEAWQEMPVGYMFEWLSRWPLIGVALAEGNILEASSHAAVLLDERQQRPPPALEAALTAVIYAASVNDHGLARTVLESAVEEAREYGYL